MEGEEFIKRATEMAKYIVDYQNNIRKRRVLPTVEPGYMQDLLPAEAPNHAENFDDIMKDVENIVMPGVTHWQSPRFNAYFPTASSYPALLADMLCGSIACIGFSWIASPACTELEVVMLDWLAEFIGLPSEFYARENNNGGGVIQGSASDATLVAMLSAKKRTLNQVTEINGESDSEVSTPAVVNLVAYASDQSHSSVERAALLSGVKIRHIESDEKFRMKSSCLQNAIVEDVKNGFVPFFVVITVGTTNCCAFDDIRKIATVANRHKLWAHVDAAYAGSALVCEEFRYLIDGVELVDSFNFNPHKWLLINFDCSAMWVKNSSDIVDAFNVDPLYLKHQHQGKVPDYRHWQIPLGRRFRALKIWFVLRIYGKVGLQKYIRKHIDLAKKFEKLVRADPSFEIVGEVVLGLVCFRLKGCNELNERLLANINSAGLIYMVPAKAKDVYFLRFAVCSRYMEVTDVQVSWDEIKNHADQLIKQN